MVKSREYLSLQIAAIFTGAPASSIIELELEQASEQGSAICIR